MNRNDCTDTYRWNSNESLNEHLVPILCSSLESLLARESSSFLPLEADNDSISCSSRSLPNRSISPTHSCDALHTDNDSISCSSSSVTSRSISPGCDALPTDNDSISCSSRSLKNRSISPSGSVSNGGLDRCLLDHSPKDPVLVNISSQSADAHSHNKQQQGQSQIQVIIHVNQHSDQYQSCSCCRNEFKERLLPTRWWSHGSGLITWSLTALFIGTILDYQLWDNPIVRINRFKDTSSGILASQQQSSSNPNSSYLRNVLQPAAMPSPNSISTIETKVYNDSITAQTMLMANQDNDGKKIPGFIRFESTTPNGPLLSSLSKLTRGNLNDIHPEILRTLTNVYPTQNEVREK